VRGHSRRASCLTTPPRRAGAFRSSFPFFPQEFRMADLFDNPMGLCGSSSSNSLPPSPNVLEPLFEKMGFSLVARHRSKDVLLYRQGDINFIVNREPEEPAGLLRRRARPLACALASACRTRTRPMPARWSSGAQPVEIPDGPMELRLPRSRASAARRCT
jgi:4-hydroxyphenylpyruvate dioxygenase